MERCSENPAQPRITEGPRRPVRRERPHARGAWPSSWSTATSTSRPVHHPRPTAFGSPSPVRTKAVLITPTGTGTGTGTGRVAAQAIASARLRPLIAEAARQGLRLAFTVRLAKTGYLHPSGSRTDSPGIRHKVVQRADHTEERSYGSAQTPRSSISRSAPGAPADPRQQRAITLHRPTHLSRIGEAEETADSPLEHLFQTVDIRCQGRSLAGVRVGDQMVSVSMAASTARTASASMAAYLRRTRRRE